MKIPREKVTGKLIGKEFEGKEYWTSLYYSQEDYCIDLHPVKVRVNKVGNHEVSISIVNDSDKTSDTIRNLSRVNRSSLEYFDNYEDSVSYYNECISDEIRYHEQIIKNLNNSFIKS